MMKRLNLIFALLTTVVFLGGCLKGTDPQPKQVGGATFINAFIEADAVYYYVDRNTISVLNPLFYRTYGPTPPIYMYPGEARLELYSTYENNRLVDTTITVQDSVFYSSFVYGTHDDPRHFITDDRVPEDIDDASAIAAVRFYNLANTDRRVTLHIGDLTPIAAFSDRPTETPQTGKEREGFIPVATGSYIVSVVDENGETVATRNDPVDLVAGSYVSIFLTGDERDPTTFYVARVYQWVN